MPWASPLTPLWRSKTPAYHANLGQTRWAVVGASPVRGLMSQVISRQYPVLSDAWANVHRHLSVFA